ncbi:MAG: 2-amino-4-hydroxy-6-hydroxymethyldihydropteridine diphosphokinase [Deltaproteobacteria bacterium]|nr:MAG: 2-amino-4-hydroxy-6-hydroxymethyldihydropteridine diphosphokinase [Deltaproteobacteria bacterium]
MLPRPEADESNETQLVVLGLGANLGDRLTTMVAATEALSELAGLQLAGRSSVYQTAPAGGPPQPDYFNAALSVRTRLAPIELLQQALDIERRLGRLRPDAIRWGPRRIDIDLLWMSQGDLDAPGLQVPHPRLCDRPFALVPLLELVPDATDPRSGLRYDTLAAAQVPLPRIGELY